PGTAPDSGTPLRPSSQAEALPPSVSGTHGFRAYRLLFLSDVVWPSRSALTGEARSTGPLRKATGRCAPGLGGLFGGWRSWFGPGRSGHRSDKRGTLWRVGTGYPLPC